MRICCAPDSQRGGEEQCCKERVPEGPCGWWYSAHRYVTERQGSSDCSRRSTLPPICRHAQYGFDLALVPEVVYIMNRCCRVQHPCAIKCVVASCRLFRGRSSVWLERLPVTQEAASSSLVDPAKIKPNGEVFHSAFCFSRRHLTVHLTELPPLRPAPVLSNGTGDHEPWLLFTANCCRRVKGLG